MQRKAVRRTGIVFGSFAVVIAALWFFWSWNWFIPIVDSQLSGALGRKVTIGHLHLRLGRVTQLIADDVVIANPDGFPAKTNFVTADRLRIRADVMAYIRGRHIVVPLIEADHPVVNAEQKPDGKANWDFSAMSAPSTNDSAKKGSDAPSPQIGAIRILNGIANIDAPKFKTDMALKIHTTDPEGSKIGQIFVDAHGTYAKQPITGRFIGGALLTLRDTAKPYPVDLKVENGPTKVSLVGTLTDPIKFEGARLKLEFSGPDMSLLYPLTGVPIPETPSYRLTGNLDYGDGKVKFHDFAGKVGTSDLNGDIDVDPTGRKTVVDADLNSHLVDLTDLAGFIGETPGRKGETPQSGQQKKELEHRETDKKFLPDEPFNIPKIEAANIHLAYKGEKIRGKYVPLDNIVVKLDIDDGRIHLHPLSFAVGKGAIVGNIDLRPQGKLIRADADVDFRRLDLSRIMEATHLFHGQGIIGGSMKIATTGNSISSFMGNGDGGVKLFIQGGGDISALLTDLIGLQIGDAVLSALGIPNRADLQCFVSDLPLDNGQLQARTFLLDTSETRVTGKGTVNMKTEALNLTLTPESKHFSVGSLPTPIDIHGTMKSPSILPQIASLALRGGAAAALGIVFPPAALLPTIQLGVGEDGACARAMSAAAHSGGAPLRPSTGRVPARRGR